MVLCGSSVYLSPSLLLLTSTYVVPQVQHFSTVVLLPVSLTTALVRKVVSAGPHGPTTTSSADSSFAPHPDLKSQSCWTVHAAGGGATTRDSKKQSTAADSSTTTEVAGSALAYPDTQYASSTFEELGLPQPTAFGVGSDNQSTMKLLQNPASKGKARHLDLRHSALREKVEHDTTRLFYTPTEHMTAGTGTKALAPAVFHRLRSYLLGHTTLPQLTEYTSQLAPQYLA